VFITFFNVFCAIACYKIAVTKGRNPKLWAVLGLLSNVVAVIVILILPNLLAAPNHHPGSNVLNSIQSSIMAYWAKLRNNFQNPNGGQLPQLPNAAANIQNRVGTMFKKPPTVATIATQIRELAQLRDDGLISDIEYQDKKQKLLDSI
jgi:hypothetical protein